MKFQSCHLFLFLAILIVTQTYAQAPPLLRCIALDENDDVTLHWTAPIDTGVSFESYLIYSRNSSSGPFTILETILDYQTESVTISGTFGDGNAFFMRTITNGGVDSSASTDTIVPIIVEINTKGKDVDLKWNATGLPSADSVYSVFRRPIGGNWNKFKTTSYSKRTATDAIDKCSEERAYRVEIKGVGGCLSVSNSPSKLIFDNIPPEPTNIICASVDTLTGNVIIEWERSESEDANGVLVFYFENFIRTDTVFGANVTSMIYSKNGINALLQVETLSVAPFDSCLDILGDWYNQAPDSLRFQTIYVDSSDYDRCAATLELKWNTTTDPNFPVGVQEADKFRIYRRENNRPSVLRGEVSGGDSIFTDTEVRPGVNYKYVIAAYDKKRDKEALSNVFKLNLAKTAAPQFLYIKSIENDHPTGLNLVHVYCDTTAETVAYGLFRSLRADSHFILVRTDSNVRKSEFTFIDESGKANQTAYYYQVVAYDLCGDIIGESQRAKSIYIGGNKFESDYINELRWDKYEGFEGAGTYTDFYDLYRSTSGSDDVSLLQSDIDSTFKDEIAGLDLVGGEICYYITAQESAGNIFEFAEASVSNKMCFNYAPKVFIPNTFTPDGDGYNDRFIPNVNFIDPTDYQLNIFNRMGNKVFVGVDPYSGWDGGKEPIGVYAYHLILTNARGEHVELTGKVHLLR